MGFAQWMRVLDTLGGLVQMTGRLRRGEEPTGLQTGAAGGPLGLIEARLAGVVVAALKEAFDRDSTRLELERSQIEAERQRAEAALQAELRRQAADRVLGQLRLVAVMAVGVWALSAALGVWLPGMRDGLSRILLGLGWLFAIGALGSAFAGWQQISRWSSDTRTVAVTLPEPGAAAFAPWLLLVALALTGASLLNAL
jgi:hypothetical protein